MAKAYHCSRYPRLNNSLFRTSVVHFRPQFTFLPLRVQPLRGCHWLIFCFPAQFAAPRLAPVCPGQIQ